MSLHHNGVLRIYPAVPLAFLLPCAAMALLGPFMDPEPHPPAPAGVLAPAQVLEVQRDGAGRATGVLLRVDSPDGPVICGIPRASFADGRLPDRHERITVDYTPTDCAPPPSAPDRLPPWGVSALGAAGLALAIYWLWAGSDRAARPRYRRTRERGRAAGVRAPGTGTAAVAGAPAPRTRRTAGRPPARRRRP
ncbi:hypothetical protein GCM10010169_45190 [Micromonospora fulviviridis]|uniref:hypothetical protein n=1 Tax=Micromonospora fulviviridis TaxID=47860 RepID=UPI001663A73F|nr:hypothetical protein [Micromonospora fulviviridis]GGR95587.1 hypothetical protein GCM10010169_45190 [Micromonospora fulviviridis]